MGSRILNNFMSMLGTVAPNHEEGLRHFDTDCFVHGLGNTNIKISLNILQCMNAKIEGNSRNQLRV
jgi:hypothetical protein